MYFAKGVDFGTARKDMYTMNDSTDETVICTIHSPMTGEICSLSDIPDPAFSKRMLGDGTAILPTESGVFAPTDGTIISVFETQHAIVFENDQHVKIFLHVGIESMRLQGEGFTAYIETGQTVHKGDKLLDLDLREIGEKAVSLASPLIALTKEDNVSIRLLAKGKVKVGEPVFELVKKN